MTVHDEEAPLLTSGRQKAKRTPIPWSQFSIVLFVQLADPLTSQLISPFAPQLIRDIGITGGDESKVGYYVGLMQALFFAAQAVTVLYWSRISDTVGRKPVLLSGLFALSVSTYCFGLSRTYWGLVLSRCLAGALYGNSGVIKSIIAEITDETNISVAYGYQPIAWSTACVLGPLIGGTLARPADRFPSLFGNSEFHKKYPYFLPCSVLATFSAITWLITFFFLKETVGAPYRPRIFRSSPKSNSDERGNTASRATATVPSDVPESAKPLPLRQLLTPRVLIAAANYASLSLVDIAFQGIRPLFFATPIELGGLGLDPPKIGKILSSFGIVNGIAQILCFARIHHSLGSKGTFVLGVASSAVLFALFPLMNYIAVRDGGVSSTVWILVGVQIVVQEFLAFSFGVIYIYIAAASPNRTSLGATNGICQVSVSIFRAIGPAAACSLFSLSMQHHYLGGYMVYYVLIVMVGASLWISSLLPARVWLK